MSKEEAKKIQWIIILIIVAVLAAAFLGIPQFLTDRIVQWLVSALISTALSMVAAALVEGFTGDLLKKVFLTRWGISAFAVATLIVKYLLFGQL